VAYAWMTVDAVAEFDKGDGPLQLLARRRLEV
jgi:hypothetical protein